MQERRAFLPPVPRRHEILRTAQAQRIRKIDRVRHIHQVRFRFLYEESHGVRRKRIRTGDAKDLLQQHRDPCIKILRFRPSRDRVREIGKIMIIIPRLLWIEDRPTGEGTYSP